MSNIAVTKSSKTANDHIIDILKLALAALEQGDLSIERGVVVFETAEKIEVVYLGAPNKNQDLEAYFLLSVAQRIIEE